MFKRLGSGYALTQFEYNKLPIFIIKRPLPNNPTAQAK
jgi:hypothetical protein